MELGSPDGAHTAARSTNKLDVESLRHTLEREGLPPKPSANVRFGDWLVRRGLINRHQLFNALNRSYLRDCRVGDAVVQLHLIDRRRVESEATAHQSFISFHRAS